MSAYYYDDIATIERKRLALETDKEKHVRQILDHVANPKNIDRIKRWQLRTPIQFLRHEVVKLCVAARSWCYDDGTDVFGFKADEHAKAMRQCLIAEMKIWLAALRNYER